MKTSNIQFYITPKAKPEEYFRAERGLSSRSSGIWTALNRSVDEKKYTAHHPPSTTHHPTKDTRSSAVIPPNFWTNLIFFIDFRPCFLHIFFI